MMLFLGELLLHRCARKCLNQHTFQFSGPANSTFARTITTDSRINIGIGATAAQNWDESVFVLSSERPCDWGDFAGVGATAAPPPVGGAPTNKFRSTKKRFLANPILRHFSPSGGCHRIPRVRISGKGSDLYFFDREK